MNTPTTNNAFNNVVALLLLPMLAILAVIINGIVYPLSWSSEYTLVLGIRINLPTTIATIISLLIAVLMDRWSNKHRAIGLATVILITCASGTLSIFIDNALTNYIAETATLTMILAK